MPNAYNINVEYELFCDSDFSDYKEDIRNWLNVHKEFFEEDECSAWRSCKVFFLFDGNLRTEIYGHDYLRNITRDEIYDDIDGMQYMSVDHAFESQFYALFREEKEKYFASKKTAATLDNE